MPYIKTQKPNKDKFAELLDAARGSRTMKEFAETCRVNPSTFTRIMQRANKGASSQTLMEAIARNAAPESGVTLEAILEANGYTPFSNGSKSITFTLEYNETAVRDVIFKELVARDAEVRLGNIRYDVSKSLTVKPDILIWTNIFEGDQHIWMMEVLAPYIKSSMDDSPGYWATKAKQKTFQHISKFTFLGMKDAAWLAPAQFSIVTSEEPVFQMIVDEFREMKVPVKISIILVDLQFRLVEDEFFLPLAGGGTTVQSFFKRVQAKRGVVASVDEYDDDDE